MLKPFTFFYLLFLPFLVAGQENSPLKELAQLFNKENTSVYRIDFIVLKHLEIEEKDKQERWPTLKNIDFNEHLIELSPDTELLVDSPLLKENVRKEINSFNYQILKEEKLDTIKEDKKIKIEKRLPVRFYEKIILNSQVDEVVRKLKLSSGYRVLFESSWYQPVFSKSYARPVYIEATDSKDRIYGQLNIYKDRYLHSEMILRFSNLTKEENTQVEVKPQNFNSILEDLTKSEVIPDDDGSYWMNTILSQIKIRFGDFNENSINLNKIKLNEEPKATSEVYFEDLYELKEERKMDEEEFYYVDHPYFGVLLRISLVK
ncbi:peptidoglycan binding protein CsiV [Gammaproteobacteria bacterium]|nr:peptidoglycan binding protein CsiV [Gammaproteobacteria bacterium]